MDTGRKVVICCVIYILMGFFTHSYCIVHRWNDWRSFGINDFGAGGRTVFAAMFWPGYWTSRAFTGAVENFPTLTWQSRSVLK